MLKIWGRNTSSNVKKILWCCDELGLEFNRIDWTGPFGGNDDPQFLKLNPNGLVPTIEDDNFVLWESNSILRYLTFKHSKGNLWPEDPSQRATAEMWMDWQLSVIRPATTPIFRGIVHTPKNKRNNSMIKEKSIELCKKWSMFDDYLEERDFILGDKISIGEFALGVHAHRFFSLVDDRPLMKNFESWYKRIKIRHGFSKYVTICP